MTAGMHEGTHGAMQLPRCRIGHGALIPGTVIIGLGNSFCSDDGVGPAVAGRVHEILNSPAVTLCELAAGGVELMETVIGYRQAVVIDALLGGPGAPGDCFLLDLSACRTARCGGTSHGIGLAEALELGRRLGLVMPDSVRVYGIVVADPVTFGAEMTGAVKAAVPEIAHRIAAELQENNQN